VLGLALIVRLLPAALLPVGAGYDIESFELVAEALLDGQDIYSAASVMGRHPYLPFQMYLVGASMMASRATQIPFVVLVKLPPILADVAITALVYRVCRRRGSLVGDASAWALAYALNPISILVSAYHGQFDSIPVLFLLTAWYLWQFGQRYTRSALALGMGIVSKTWPVVLLPIVFIRARSRRSKLGYVAIAFGIPMLFTAIYLMAFHGKVLPLLGRALTHTGVPGYWGITGLLALGGNSSELAESIAASYTASHRWILFCAGLGTLWATRRQSGLDALVTTILGVLAVSAGMGLQWLLWVVPFALLSGDTRGLKWYSLTGSVYLLLQLYGLHFSPWVYERFQGELARSLIIASAIPSWITVVGWTARRLTRRTQGPPAGGPGHYCASGGAEGSL
jgi:hypothetical protein